MTQTQTILTHLKEHGSIDTMTAIKEYWITRLSAHIKILREQGFKIVSVWVTDGKKNWVDYRMVQTWAFI